MDGAKFCPNCGTKIG
ncbi:MAG: zinc-ribbon domain-containing protein [Candidatus Thorarchaeota archaeon]